MKPIVAVAGFWLVLASTTALSAQPPNIILILTDDQGWNNTSTPMMPDRPGSRSDYYQTPHLDHLAAAGIVFSDGYAAAAICSPSRHAIQFGISPGQLHKPTNRGTDYSEPFATAAIPQVLKAIASDYRAAHFGKWHMFQTPEALGYDESDGRTGNRTGGFSTTDQRRFWAKEDPKQIGQITDKAIDFMQRQSEAEHPFYVQVSHYAIHLNAEAREESLEKHKQRPAGDVHTAYWYAAMIDDLDAAVGRLLEAVRTLGIEENTYVFFTSDNGGLARQFPGFNEPLRAGKGSFYEGGLRVPFIVAGPGIPAGSRSAVPVIGWDLLPTFAELAGGSDTHLPERVEGGSLQAVLCAGGHGEVRRPREGLFFYKPQGAVVRRGEYKLKRNDTEPRWELFRLSADLSESENLAELDPSRTEAMRTELESWIEEMQVGSGPERRANSRPDKPAAPVTMELKQDETLTGAAAPRVDGLNIELTVTVKPSSPDGVIFAHGGAINGYALYLKSGKPVFAVRNDHQVYEAANPHPIRQGQPTQLAATLAEDGTLSVGVVGGEQATADSPGLLKISPTGQLNVGWDYSSPVAEYDPFQTPHRFQGEISGLTLRISRTNDQ